MICLYLTVITRKNQFLWGVFTPNSEEIDLRDLEDLDGFELGEYVEN